MPFVHSKPWRVEFFDHIKCPEHVRIPTEDCDAWTLNPKHRWVYDKLSVALAQGLEAAPHCVLPPTTSYPVFSKPITNLKGMGVGSRIIPDEATFVKSFTPGHFWCTLLKGDHISTDAAVVNGEMVWSRHTTGVPLSDGMFDYWHIHKETMPELESRCGAWIRQNLADYTGMVNFETIGGTIIEFHLRFTPQWADLYGQRWLEAVVRLYAEKRWDYDDNNRNDLYSVILWGLPQRQYRLPPASEVTKARATTSVSSIQVPFYENIDPATTSNPPGGFRLAIINCRNLNAGRKAASILREAIKEAPSDQFLVDGITARHK
ncbi:hypothetical protein DFQ26_009807 [Actinomortierella ambigua]|nr:hypothetical protein DFQ26_009807 [Actinomortierella ambigua]